MATREDDDGTPVESSLDELLAKKAADPAVDEDDSDVLDLDIDVIPDDSLDPLSVKAIPQQANEFTCRSCFLVKHRSQIADEKRLVCHDCV